MIEKQTQDGLSRGIKKERACPLVVRAFPKPDTQLSIADFRISSSGSEVNRQSKIDNRQQSGADVFGVETSRHGGIVGASNDGATIGEDR